jgi:hypothetical protein
MMTSSNTRPTRSRSTRARKPQRTNRNGVPDVSEGATGSSRVFMRRWLESSVQSKASSEDDGSARCDAVETTALLTAVDPVDVGLEKEAQVAITTRAADSVLLPTALSPRRVSIVRKHIAVDDDNQDEHDVQHRLNRNRANRSSSEQPARHSSTQPPIPSPTEKKAQESKESENEMKAPIRAARRVKTRRTNSSRPLCTTGPAHLTRHSASHTNTNTSTHRYNNNNDDSDKPGRSISSLKALESPFPGAADMKLSVTPITATSKARQPIAVSNMSTRSRRSASNVHGNEVKTAASPAARHLLPGGGNSSARGSRATTTVVAPSIKPKTPLTTGSHAKSLSVPPATPLSRKRWVD